MSNIPEWIGEQLGPVGAAVIGSVAGFLTGGFFWTLGGAFWPAFAGVSAAAIGTAEGAAWGYSIGAISEGIALSNQPIGNTSRTYSGDSPIGTVSNTIPIAKSYGRVLLAGNLIRSNTKDESTFKLIVSHCLGEIDSITATYLNSIEWSSLDGTHYKTTQTGTDSQTGVLVNSLHLFGLQESGYRGVAHTGFELEKDNQITTIPTITSIIRSTKCRPIGVSVVNSSYKWTSSGGEYYCEDSGGGDPGLSEPAYVEILGVNADQGTKGALNGLEWDWALDPGESYYTLWVKLSSGADPDTLNDHSIVIEGAEVFSRNPAIVSWDFYRKVYKYQARYLNTLEWTSLSELCSEYPSNGEGDDMRPPGPSTSTVKATTTYSGYSAAWACDISAPITGGYRVEDKSEWSSTNGSTTNQRFNVDLGIDTLLKSIKLINSHNSGTSLTDGIKSFRIQGSNESTAFDETTFATDTNWNALFADSGTATSGGASTLTDSGQSWTTNELEGLELYIVGGTGSGQNQTISSNTDTVITVDTPWGTEPDDTSEYQIRFLATTYSSGVIQTFDIPNPSTAYRYYSLKIYDNQGGSYIKIRDLWFRGINPRYTFDYNFDTTGSLNDHVKIIWNSFNGTVIRSQGQFKPVWYWSQESDGSGSLTSKSVKHAFTTDNIVRGSFSWEKRERSNVVEIQYINSHEQFKKDSIILKDDADIEYRGEIPYTESCMWITNSDISRRKAKLILDDGRYCDYSCILTGLDDSSDVEVYDLVTVTHPGPAWTEKEFVVLSKDENSLGEPTFTLKTYYSGIFGDLEEGEKLSYFSAFDNPREKPLPCTNIALAVVSQGTNIFLPTVNLTFDPPNDPFYSHANVYVGIVSAEDNGTATDGFSNTLTDTNKSWTPNEFAGYELYIIAGTGLGQNQTISSNTDTVITVDSAFGTWPDDTSVYAIVNEAGTPSEYYYYGKNDSGAGYLIELSGQKFDSGDTVFVKLQSVRVSGVKQDIPSTADDSVIVTTLPYLGTLDDVADGTYYGRVLANALSEGAVLLSEAAGTLDDIADNLYGKVLASDLSGGHILMGSIEGDLDDIDNGSTYGRILLTDISAGHIVLSEVVGDLDDIADGSSYGRILLTDISAGHILLAEAVGDLDDISDGTTYGKVLATDISAGHIVLSEVVGDLDDIADGSSYGRILLTDISAGHIVLAETIGDLDDIADGTSYGKVLGTDISAGHIVLVGSTASININDAVFANEGIQLQYNAGSPQLYVGDGANEYFKYTTAGGVQISSSQATAIQVLGGGDISLTGNDAAPGSIKFVGSSITTELSCNTTGNLFTLQTDSISAGMSLYFTANYDADNNAELQIVSALNSSYIAIDLEAGGTTYRYSFSKTHIGVNTDNTYDLGTSALAFKDAYFEGVVYTDTIGEINTAAGVTIDGVLLKDTNVTIGNSNWIGIGSASERINFYTAGYVSVMGAYFGVGIASPANQLHVYASGTSFAKIESGSGSGDAGYSLKNADRQYNFFVGGASYSDSFVIRDSTAGANRFAIDTSGVLSSPISYSHDMNGETIRALQVNSDGEFGYDSSWSRAKGNIVRKTSEERIYLLSGVEYNPRKKIHHKNGTTEYLDEYIDKKRIGLIAEEVAEIWPEIVYFNENGEAVGIHYQELIVPILIEFQKAKKEIGELKNKLDNLMKI